jgi:hypothetical protein
MNEPLSQVVRVRRFGDPDELEVVDAPMPSARQGEVRVCVASGIEYTDVVIRRHLYAQNDVPPRPPFVMGYERRRSNRSARRWRERLSDRRSRGRMTVLGSNATYRTLRARDLARLPTGRRRRELARWLLMMHDRADMNTMPLTQDFLAEILGVARTTVTAAARALKFNDLISDRRRVISIKDRAGLESAACECDRVLRSHFERLPPRG